MAKKRRSGSAGAPAGVTFTSEVLRHVNKQTFSGTATDAVAEAISTPGYSEAGYSGCLIVGAQVSFKNDAALGIPGADNVFCAQIQSGDRSGTPALLDPDEVGFFAQIVMAAQITTSGLILEIFPKRMTMSMPVPIVVMPKLTICHDNTANIAEMQSASVFTEFFYRTVKLAPVAYSSLLLQQQRTS